MKRVISSRSYSGLFLMPARLSAGERLLVSLKTPPSSIGTYSNFTPGALFDFRNDEMAQIGIGTAEVEMKFYSWP